MNVDLKITGRVESLHLEPGDTVVAMIDQKLTPDEGVSLREALRKKFPDHDVLVAADGLRISKVTQ